MAVARSNNRTRAETMENIHFTSVSLSIPRPFHNHQRSTSAVELAAHLHVSMHVQTSLCSSTAAHVVVANPSPGICGGVDAQLRASASTTRPDQPSHLDSFWRWPTHPYDSSFADLYLVHRCATHMLIRGVLAGMEPRGWRRPRA